MCAVMFAALNRRLNSVASHSAVLNSLTANGTKHVRTEPFVPQMQHPMVKTVANVVEQNQVSPPSDEGDDMLPEHNTLFTIAFENDNNAQAMRVVHDVDPNWVLQQFELVKSKPAIFITGGASLMSEEDTKRTADIIQAVADFAQEHGATIIDGGTESGVMQMVGDARRKHDYTFPLIGVCPLGKISYPGYTNPNEEAFLEDSHSHFVLVDGEEWGSESEVIVNMTHAIAGNNERPAIGILINGGNISKQEVYLAISKEVPMLVLEGSGRFADEVATAFKTGNANQRILQAILGGGDIQLVNTVEGPDAMREKLESRFK